MAEANLLPSGTDLLDAPSGPDRDLRAAFARVLQENAELRQRLNGVVRQRIASVAAKFGGGARGPGGSPAGPAGPVGGARGVPRGSAPATLAAAPPAENGVAAPSEMLAGIAGGANKLLTRLRSTPPTPSAGAPSRAEGGAGLRQGAPGGPASGSPAGAAPGGPGVLSGGLNRLSGLAQRFAGRDGHPEGT